MSKRYPGLFNEKTIKKNWGIEGDKPLVIGMDRDGDVTNVNEFGHLYSKDLIVDGNYHLYKLEDVVMVDSDQNMYFYFFPGMELNSYGIPAVISHLKDKKVDFYLSMKLTGDISCNDPENYPAFRIDRIFVVDKN